MCWKCKKSINQPSVAYHSKFMKIQEGLELTIVLRMLTKLQYIKSVRICNELFEVLYK